MQETSVLDLADFAPTAPSPSRRRAAPFALAAGVVVASAGLLAMTFPQGAAFGIDGAMRALGLSKSVPQAAVRLSLDELQQVAGMTVDDKAQLVANGLDAQARNAAIPVAGLPLEQAHSFLLQAFGQPTFATGLKCLTQAVYYEAAVEPMQGRRAVAQVVLNRMRHPAYPKSVCGVVYQGSERRTGCQFSFTCDGSLLRGPSAKGWREAEEVARAALAGYVEKSVGTATHYHADYVLPKWAFQLAKIDQLGRHIFYRFQGNWGRATALNGRYAGVENLPSVNFLALQERLLADGSAVMEETFTPGLTVAPHVTDRHAAADVGGRLDVTKEWRLTIPDPVEGSSRYRQTVAADTAPAKPVPVLAVADQPVRAEP